MKIQIDAPNKVFNAILKVVNAQLTLWTKQPQFNCRPIVRGNDIKLIGYGKNANKDKWVETFAGGVVDYLKTKYNIVAIIDNDTMKFQFKEDEVDNSTADKGSDRPKKKPGTRSRKVSESPGD